MLRQRKRQAHLKASKEAAQSVVGAFHYILSVGCFQEVSDAAISVSQQAIDTEATLIAIQRSANGINRSLDDTSRHVSSIRGVGAAVDALTNSLCRYTGRTPLAAPTTAVEPKEVISVSDHREPSPELPFELPQTSELPQIQGDDLLVLPSGTPNVDTPKEDAPVHKDDLMTIFDEPLPSSTSAPVQPSSTSTITSPPVDILMDF
eukprot:gnl/Dysnectes_brevis/5611_a8170_674.p1 GENE.gnl/Dysnectes_brevis/5611_a8170_674~~gnl/Dysnectes_brevis/5611_a8170_674.p1  ORF type:complete len:205 (-),score=27.43 gnl/Dysnectes_brevis/5611_a8170_674:30-644(-)